MKALQSEADLIQQRISENLPWDAPTPVGRTLTHSTSMQYALQYTIMLINRPSLPTADFSSVSPQSPSSADAAISAALRTSFICESLSKRDAPTVPLAAAALTEAPATLGLALLGAGKAGLIVDEEVLIVGLQRCLIAVRKGTDHPLATFVPLPPTPLFSLRSFRGLTSLSAPFRKHVPPCDAENG